MILASFKKAEHFVETTAHRCILWGVETLC